MENLISLLIMNIATSEVTVISKEISWDVDGFSISEDSKKAAFVVNENGYSSLYLLKPESLLHLKK